MFTRRSLLTHIAVVVIGSISVCAAAFAQQTSLPFKIFDSHTHFVSNDKVKYPVRKDLPPLKNEQEMLDMQLLGLLVCGSTCLTYQPKD
jgi:hypothetical protein